MIKIGDSLSSKLANMSFVGAVLIVCHHFGVKVEAGRGLWWLSSILGQAYTPGGGGLTWIGVPWFFLASGFFLAGHMGEDGWWGREVRKRLRTLVVPFFFWAFGAIAFLTLMDLSQGRTPYFGSVKSIAKGIGFYPYCVVNPMASQLWYIRALMMLVILSPLIWRFIGKWWLVIVFVVYAVVAPFDGVEWSKFFRYGFSLEGLFYFSLGVYLRFHPIRSPQLQLVSMISLSIGLGLIIIHSFFYLDGHPLTCYLKWLSTPFLLFGIFGLVPSMPWPKMLVSSAFPIYVMHRMFLWPFYGFGSRDALGGGFHWMVVRTVIRWCCFSDCFCHGHAQINAQIC